MFRAIKLTGLRPMTVVMGANGSSMSTLFDLFSFLKDALSGNVASAVARRGEFGDLVGRGEAGPASIAVKFREAGRSEPAVVGGSVTGNIETRQDHDWFSVTLEAGKTYRIDVEGRWSGGGTLLNPALLGIYDSEAVRIPGTADDDSGHGYSSQLEFKATQSGTYYLEVRGHSFANREFGSTGTYTVSVTEVTDDYGADTGTAGRVTPGGSVTGELETPLDRDWLAVTLQGGSTYQFDLEGVSGGGGTLDNPYLSGIYNSRAQLQPGTTDDNGGSGYNSKAVFTPNTTGTYYVEAASKDSWRGKVGTYTLSVEEIDGF